MLTGGPAMTSQIRYVLYDARTLHLVDDGGWNVLRAPAPPKIASNSMSTKTDHGGDTVYH